MNISKTVIEASAIQSHRDPDAMELWLRRSLSERFATVLEEELPEAWLTLLGRPDPKP